MALSPPIKTCISCAHFHPDLTFRLHHQAVKFGVCHHPVAYRDVDLKTGERDAFQMWHFADTERLLFMPPHCGPDGRNWTPKEEPLPQPDPFYRPNEGVLP